MGPRVELVHGLERLRLRPLTFPAYRPLLMGAGALALAAYDPDPIGLLVARPLPDADGVELLSVFVRKARRRQGVASALLRALDEVAARRGGGGLCARFEDGRPYRVAVRALLRRHGFAEPTAHARVGRSTLQHPDLDRPEVLPRWFTRPRLPKRAEVFDWSALTPAEVEAARAQGGFPAPLDPAGAAEPLEPRTSVGLRRDGRVLGWMITHRIAPELIRYTALHVEEELAALGFGASLWAVAFARHLAWPRAERPGATFVSYPETPRMIAFAERHFGRYLDSLNTSYLALKPLSAGARS